MKKEISYLQILSCELVGLFHQFTLLRKIRGFTFEKAFDYYTSHEVVDPYMLRVLKEFLFSSDEFCKGMNSNPLTYLKGINIETLRILVQMFCNCISSLEYVYEID